VAEWLVAMTWQTLLLALGAHSPALVPAGMYQGAFAKKYRVRGLPAPRSPVAPRSWVP
jgi:hypothetical protein